ncbi:MAG TPA: DNRLRE domain-containing protein [Actinomycetota bacterium]
MRALRLLAVLGLAGAALVAGPVPGAGAEQTGPVVAGQDAYVISTAVRTTYDTTELRVRNTPAQKLQAYLTFDLRGVPAGATGLRATLRLTAGPASQSGRVEVRTSGAFNERTVTWAGRPAASAVQGSAAVARGATVLVDAGPLGGPGVRSYALTAPAGQGAQLRFAASEDPDPARRPALTVTWTPPAPPVSDRLVPREGAWWGSYPGQAPGDVEAREAVYGRRVDILHRYHDWDDIWPTSEEQAYAAGGRILFEGWENRVFGGTTSCWADIAGGTFDAAIDAQAQRLAAFGDRLFVGFMHEPEDNAGPCQPGAVDDAKADMGSAEDFRAAFRHVVERIRPVAPNVVWVFSVMGHDPAASWAFYPGDDVVDWVAWDPYNWANCAGRTRDSWRGFAQVAQGMYAHLDAVGNTKPWMLGEYGSHDDPALGSKAQWLRDVPSALRTTLPKLKAVVYFDRLATPVPGDPCAWLADSSPEARAGFAAGVSDSYLNQPHN